MCSVVRAHSRRITCPIAGGTRRGRIPHEEASTRGGARSRKSVREALGTGKVFGKKGMMGGKFG
jgi:hypothetical protein